MNTKFKLVISENEEIQTTNYDTFGEASDALEEWLNTYKYNPDGTIDEGFQISYNETRGKALVETENEIIGFACIIEP